MNPQLWINNRTLRAEIYFKNKKPSAKTYDWQMQKPSAGLGISHVTKEPLTCMAAR